MINDSKILKSIINDIYEFSIENTNLNFSECINIYRETLYDIFESPIKKKKVMKDDETCETDEEEYIHYDYGDSSDDSSDDEQPIIIDKNKTNKYFKESKEFVNNVFKVQNENPQTEIINHFTNLPDIKRKSAILSVKEINNYQQTNEPILFQILKKDIIFYHY
jgi:hypothetical protein